MPLTLAGLDESSSLAYSRSALMEGRQYWRLLTAHLAHTNLAHTLLNLAAWPLVFWLAQGRLSIRQWAIGFLFCAFGVSFGLWWFLPAVEWYVGLSSVLHGLLVLSALAVWQYELIPALLVLLGVGVKRFWEQTSGALPGSAAWISHPVVIDAHLFGALSGMLCFYLYPLLLVFSSRIHRWKKK